MSKFLFSGGGAPRPVVGPYTNILRSYKGCLDSDKSWEEMAAWHQSFEYIRMRGVTPELKEANKLLREQCYDIQVSDFSILNTRGGKMSEAAEIYRIIGHFIFVYDQDVYILDYSAMDQVHACAKFCINYRISGNLGSEKSDMLTALKKSVKWIVNALENSTYSESLARSMKQSLAFLQNGFHPDAEKLEMGMDQRAKDLRKVTEEILELKTYCHGFVSSLDITDRAKLDIAHLYYGIPAPDCDLELLVRRATEYMSTAKTADPEVFNDLLNYCKALDFCQVLARVRRLENIGYDPTEQRWFI
jgi:hypothetical protein